ncbi:site-specific integrase [Arenimonas caeni]|uniref:site-specific integrase n=1 Tax=Arenimonas caeni TaxID=2058085 RepID=UPI0013B06E0A|nr:site-specific integrase [Arenimonas caeni]
MYTLIRQALPDHLLPSDLIAPHELARGLQMLFSGLAGLYPQNSLWRNLATEASEIEQATRAEAFDHGSRHDSQANNPITGHMVELPVYASLVHWGPLNQRQVRSRLSALALAPIVVPRLTATDLPNDPKIGRDAAAERLPNACNLVLTELRKTDNSTLLERIAHDFNEHLTWGEDGLQLFCQPALPVPAGPARWVDVYKAVNRLIETRPRLRLQPTRITGEPDPLEAVRTHYFPEGPISPDEAGLAPEDRGTHRYVEAIEGPASVDDCPSALRLNSGYGLLCAMPPWHLTALPPSDAHALSQSILASLGKDEEVGGIVLGALSILTAVPTEMLMDASIEPSLEAMLAGTLPPTPTLAWDCERLLAFLPSKRPERAHRRQPEDRCLEDHQTGVVVGIPDSLARLVRARLPGSVGTLRAAFPKADQAWPGTLSEIKAKLRLALTPTRVRQCVSMEILRQTQSTWMASTAQPDSGMVHIVLAHYAALPAERLYDVHRAACAALFGDELTPPELEDRQRSLLSRWIGSELIPDLDEWHGLIEDAFTRVQTQIARPADTLDAAVACANNVNRLVHHCLRVGTAARPHDGLFNLRQDLDVDLRLAQLAEKQSNLRDTTRLCPLDPVLCDLEAARRRMVRWIADRLSDVDPTLAGGLLSTLGGHEAYPSAPVLFVLKKQRGEWRALPINGEEECALWPQSFPWARNANRGALVQFLLGRGMREDAIRALLGHSDFAGTVADPNCPQAPAALLDELRPHLSAFLTRLGVRPLAWPQDKGADPNKTIALVTSPTPLFGDFDAERVHQRTQSRLLVLRMQAVFHEVALSRLPAELILPRIRDLLTQALADDPRQRERALERVDRKLSSLSLSQLKQRFRSRASVRRHLMPRIEHPTPYAREEIRAIRLGGRLREQVLARLEAQWPAALDEGVASAQALVLLAAMAAGALVPKDSLMRFQKALPDLYVDGDQVWIEYTENHQTWRWVADKLTATLLVGYHARFGHRPAVPEEQILRAADAWLVRLAGGCGLPDGTPRSRLRWLRTHLLAWFRHHVPGTLLSHADASRPSAALPRSALARLKGHYVKTPPRRMRRSTPRIKALNVPKKQQIDAALEQLGREAGIAGTSLGDTEMASLRKELATLCTPKSGTARNALTVAAEAFLRFVYSLRTEGGRLKPVLAESTIGAYLSPIRRLLELLPEDTLLDVDPAEREAIYRKVYVSAGQSERSRRLLALQMFHEMLEDLWGAEPIDWSAVTADAARGASRIDANVVWPHERERAVALLRHGPLQTQVEREAAELLLHLMAALGARFGEAFHLRLRDIGHEERFALIRPNRENKKLKSDAATRRVLLAERLTPRGRELLRRTVARVRLRDPHAADLPLFGEPRSPRHLMDRARVHALLTQALRLATGDANVRPHHLRHTYANETYAHWVAPTTARDRQAREARRDLFGTDVPSRRAVAHWAVTLGHADMETGHLVYLHQQEWRVAQAATSLLPRLEPAQATALWGRSTRAPGTRHALVRALAAGKRSLAPWRGLTLAQPPREMPPDETVDAAPHWPDTDELHRILTHPAKERTSAVELGALFGVAPAMMATLLAGERDVYEESLYFRGQLPAGLGDGRPSQFRACQLTRTLPPGFLTLPGRERINALPDTPEHRAQARAVIALWRDRDRRADRLQPEKVLLDALQWYLAMGCKPKDLVVRVPDKAWRAWCRRHPLFKDVRVTTLSPTKPSDCPPRLRIRATHAFKPINSGAVAYQAQLWLVRALASDRHGRPDTPAHHS